MSEYRDHWQGKAASHGVRGGTGAPEGLDDIRAILAGSGWEPTGKVLDIGCGTGRLSELCEDYTGCDIAPAMVEYGKFLGLNVSLIDGPQDVPAGKYDRIAAFSVFTHIPRHERQAFLAVMADRLADGGEMLVDILPGNEGGSIAEWYANQADFERDLADAGFTVISVSDFSAQYGYLHRYYRVK